MGQKISWSVSGIIKILVQFIDKTKIDSFI